MRNVEIKAKVHNIEKIIQMAKGLSGGEATVIKQDDVFYKTSNRRLKMRYYSDCAATLLGYDREDTEGPKMSDFDLLNFSPEEHERLTHLRTAKPAKLLDDMLTKCLGLRGRLKKERKLFMVGQTRIHIDTVETLGDFMELEVVLRPEQTLEEGQAIARDLQSRLGVRDEDLINCAYMDLLERNGKCV